MRAPVTPPRLRLQGLGWGGWGVKKEEKKTGLGQPAVSVLRALDPARPPNICRRSSSPPRASSSAGKVGEAEGSARGAKDKVPRGARWRFLPPPLPLDGPHNSSPDQETQNDKKIKSLRGRRERRARFLQSPKHSQLGFALRCRQTSPEAPGWGVGVGMGLGGGRLFTPRGGHSKELFFSFLFFLFLFCHHNNINNNNKGSPVSSAPPRPRRVGDGSAGPRRLRALHSGDPEEGKAAALITLFFLFLFLFFLFPVPFFSS